MQSQVQARCYVAMYDLQHGSLVERHLPSKMRSRLQEAVSSFGRVYPFPQLTAKPLPGRSAMPISTCRSVFDEVYERLTQKVEPLLDSDSQDLREKREQLIVLRGQLAALAIAAASFA